MKKQKMISIIIIAILFLATATPVFANTTNTKKEENVYVNLNDNGSIDNIYVVNQFNLTEDSEIIDYGKYSNLRNLSTSDDIKQEDTLIKLTGKKGENYYQGALETKDIPWNINIKYYLNGVEKKASEIIGETGKIEIKINITKNENVDESFFNSYMLQSTMYLNAENCNNIETEAMIANNGKNKQLTFMVLPGAEKEISIKFDAKDFEMEGISFNGILMSMAVDIDTSNLTDSTGKLIDAIDSISNGSTALKDGSKKYNQGVKAISENMNKLAISSNQIKQGIGTSLQGLQTIEKQLNNMSMTIPQTDKTAIQTQIQKSSTSIVTDEVTKQITEFMTNIQSGNDTIYNTLYQTDPQLANAYIASTKEKITKTSANVATRVANQTSETISQTYNNSISKTLEETKTKINTLKTALKQLEQGLNTLNTNYTTFNNGLSLLNTNTTKLYNSYTSINEGISKLNNGANTLNNETSGLNDKIQEEIDKAKEKFQNSNYKQISFVSPENTNIDAVQFVIKTDGLQKEEVEEEVKEEDSETSLWEKFINLFE